MATEPAARSTITDAFCIKCGYPLQGNLSNRCPECGRVFDPGNPRSMSVGSPLRRWQRWLLRPVSGPAISLPLLGTLGLLYLSGWPGIRPEPWRVLLSEFHRPKFDPKPTVADAIFYLSILLWAAFLVLTGPRRIASFLLVPSSARAINRPALNTRWRRRGLAVAVILSASSLLFGWEGRLGKRWTQRVLASPPPSTSTRLWTLSEPDPSPDPPVPLTDEQASEVLGAALLHLPSAKDRMVALSLLVERGGRKGMVELRQAASRESDPGLLIWELRLIGLCRDPASAPFLIDRLQDQRPLVRAAAADAIGLLRQPSYSVHVPDGFWMAEPLSLDVYPPIGISGIVSDGLTNSSWRGYAEHDLALDAPIQINSSARAALLKMMTGGTIADEQEAAARALVAWPPAGYRLRLAEWGVWIESKGHMALAQSIVDEIPPFVHRTGNPLSGFGDYFMYPSQVTKPIVHLTCNEPLAVDVEAFIRAGRPWFAFPKQDDFGVNAPPDEYDGQPLGQATNMSWRTATSSGNSDDFAAPAIAPLSGLREGYPWITPHHRLRGFDGRFGDPRIYSVGIHWQSVVVSPSLLPGAVPPVVPAEARFRWWDRLRQVSSSWVSSRGESERFLYYDGPTRAPVPITVALGETGNLLRFAVHRFEKSSSQPPWADPPEQLVFHPLLPPATETPPKHDGLYIDCHGGVLRGVAISIGDQPTFTLPADLPLHGEEVIGSLRKMIVDYGLSPSEAEGLIAAWTPQFFKTEGRRFVLRLSPEEYARQCPIQVRPSPTEVVRLGLVLTEFDPVPASGDAR